jgi:aminoglycoside phosphotransferase (APT) family kinase protein
MVKEINPLDILATLGMSTDATVKPVSGGLDTLLWRVTYKDKTFALRLFRSDQADQTKNELLNMQKAFAGGIVVPEVYKFSTWQERPVMLMAWCDGNTMADALKAQPYNLWSFALEFGRIHAKINQINFEATPTNTWINWLGTTEPELQTYLRTLNTPSPVLLHLDYHPLNVMFNNGKVSGVLDWTTSCGGDKRADFARSIAILRLSPIENNLAFAIIRRVMEWGWRRGYQEVSGKLEGLAPFHAWAGALMVREYTPRLNNPALGVKPVHIKNMRRWADYWKAKIRL